MNKQLKELLDKRRKVENTLGNIQLAIDEIYLDTKIPCAKCNNKTKVWEMSLYRIYYKEIIAEYQYVCKYCSYANRILFKATPPAYRENMILFERNFLKRMFNNIKDVWHDENEPAKKLKFVNNFYIENLINEEKEYEEKYRKK